MRNNIKMPKQVRHDNMQGRSMVEMLGVLAIIGVLSAGGLAGYSKAMFKHKLNSTMEQITMLVTNIRTAYGQQGNYNGLTATKAGQLGIVPAVMGTGENLTNPFKGSVGITSNGVKASNSSAAGTAFTVTYEGLPKEACIALATSDFGSGAGSGFIGVVVNSKKDEPFVGDASAAGHAADAEHSIAASSGKLGEGNAYTMSAAVTDCDTEQNTITWKFY